MKADYVHDRTAAWGFGNTVLYRMCLEEPGHGDPDVTAGKLWLIGRAYAASPERGSGEANPGENLDFFSWLAQGEGWEEVDTLLSKLDATNSFNAVNIINITMVHHAFVQILTALIQRRLSDRAARMNTSFSSKYLHFHRPDHFPIYDSYVSAALARQYPRIPVPCQDGTDRPYWRFCRLMLMFLRDRKVTLRGADRHLYEFERCRRQAAMHAIALNAISVSG